MATLIAVFFAGMAAGVIVTLVTAAIVALDNDNEYLDYPPEDMEYHSREE